MGVTVVVGTATEIPTGPEAEESYGVPLPDRPDDPCAASPGFRTSDHSAVQE